MSFYTPSRGWRDRRSTHPPRINRESVPPDSRDIFEGLRPVPILDLQKPTLSNTDDRVRITDLHYIGSYDWTDKSNPTIIVPGSPRFWKNRATPYQVQPDIGLQLQDQNGFRCSNSVLLPLITAVNWMNKDKKFNWKAVDFVTDRNSLRKLLRWIRDDAAKDFRIDLQLTGNTVLLNRWENSYHTLMSGQTFGFNFEKASTTPGVGCEDSTGHHRIVRYVFSGITLVVRYEVDACIPFDASPTTSPRSPTMGTSKSNSIDDLVGAMSGISLHKEVTKPTFPSATSPQEFPEVTVLPGGSVVPQSALVELTTRSAMRAINFNWKEAYPQLYLSQTPHYFLGVHNRGRFQEVMKRKLESAEMEEIADENQADLRALRAALGIIKELAVEHGDGSRLSLVCRRGKMGVYKRISEASYLPEAVLQLFKD